MTDENTLNKKQQEAVETTEGRVKIVAGAGSGKTSVLVHRYAYLVNELGIDPNNILCMTFTNKAAAEMKNRIGKLTASSNVNDYVCTIHGFCVKFIRREGYRIGFAATGKDLSKKTTAQVRYPIGFERMVRAAVKNLEKLNLKSNNASMFPPQQINSNVNDHKEGQSIIL